MRNLDSYIKDFDKLPFEATQAHYRKKNFLEVIKKYSNISSVLEVGCGTSSIFEYMDFPECHLVEPINEFIDRLKHRISCDALKIHNMFLEDFNSQQKFDLVVASCVLHEIDDSEPFLDKIADLLNEDGIFFVDVPNARSFHRFYTVQTGHLDDLYANTTTANSNAATAKVFDKNSLINLLTKTSFLLRDRCILSNYFITSVCKIWLKANV